MSRSSRTLFVLGCAVVLWLEAPRTWSVVAADVSRVVAESNVPTAENLGPSLEVLAVASLFPFALAQASPVLAESIVSDAQPRLETTMSASTAGSTSR